jgi:fused signal recognition particle receptor
VGLFNYLNLDKVKKGLSKTRDKLIYSITEIFKSKKFVDEQAISELEEILLTNDIGSKLTDQIIEKIKRVNLKNENQFSDFDIITEIKKELSGIFKINGEGNGSYYDSLIKPFVILVIGVNGVGKTTTIGKLAYLFRIGGAKVIVAAADTFRAGAGEQLDIWAIRAGADILQPKSSADPSSVAFDAVKKAIVENYDVVIIDTAGRLHNKINLMNELAKLRRAVDKALPGAPHETLLVLDAAVGQNAVIQANEFSKVTEISGLVITKLDGTAKGGAVFQICNSQKIPVKFIGVGEKIDDLQPFDPVVFVDALFNKN